MVAEYTETAPGPFVGLDPLSMAELEPPVFRVVTLNDGNAVNQLYQELGYPQLPRETLALMLGDAFHDMHHFGDGVSVHSLRDVAVAASERGLGAIWVGNVPSGGVAEPETAGSVARKPSGLACPPGATIVGWSESDTCVAFFAARPFHVGTDSGHQWLAVFVVPREAVGGGDLDATAEGMSHHLGVWLSASLGRAAASGRPGDGVRHTVYRDFNVAKAGLEKYVLRDDVPDSS